jgi:hypothetical protein
MKEGKTKVAKEKLKGAKDKLNGVWSRKLKELNTFLYAYIHGLHKIVKNTFSCFSSLAFRTGVQKTTFSSPLALKELFPFPLASQYFSLSGGVGHVKDSC